ncbi:MAG: zincin-like metallopeptidase domain-containing protein [Acidiferrobacterales bacterium]|nr:zincin-like metallopeptidase domain-containing protein [Acidiferrobacterales bacterium]
MAANEVNNLYFRITNQFLEALKRGAPPWKKPWSDIDQYCDRPVNAVTERKYSGINVAILWSSAVSHGFTRDRWLTFKQVGKAGGRVKRGQKGTAAVLYRDIRVAPKESDGTQSVDEDDVPKTNIIKLIRGFTLFNVEQCTGLPDKVIKGPPVHDQKPAWKLHQEAEDLIISNKVSVHHTSDSASYTPKGDFICMPPKCAFENKSDYYSTLMHELTHWTGHSTRLSRPGITNGSRIGTTEYAFEEMIAEIGSAFLCAEFRIPRDPSHDSYILSWIEVLENDPKAIFNSSAQAWKARNFLLGEGCAH